MSVTMAKTGLARHMGVMWTRRPLLRSFLGLLGASAGGAVVTRGMAQQQDGDAVAATGADAAPAVFQYPESGARARRWAEVSSKRIELSGFTGADPTGTKDSYVAVQRALEVAAQRHGELVIDGGFRISLAGRAPLRITTPLSLCGAQPRLGNITTLSSHGAALYFEQDAPAAIVVEDTQLTVSGCALIGPARLSTGSCVKTIGSNSALRLCNGAVVQSWHTGIVFENGFYHRINDACILDCITGIDIVLQRASSGIYNLVVSQLKLTAAMVTGSVAMHIRGGSQVSIAQSSFESFTGNGIVVEDSNIDLFSNYFEGNGGSNILLERRAGINAVGNRVYLSEGAANWIRVSGPTAVEARVVAFGNHFVPPQDGKIANIYTLHRRDPMAVSNIGEDVILNRATMGPGVHYVAQEFFAEEGPTALRGSHNIRFPAGDPRQYDPVATMPVAMAPARSMPGSAPGVPTLLSYACDAQSDADPGKWRSGGWGANPMMMVFHRSAAVPGGQWEKVGLRLPHIALPAGGTVVDKEARQMLATLIEAFASQAVMPRR